MAKFLQLQFEPIQSRFGARHPLARFGPLQKQITRDAEQNEDQERAHINLYRDRTLTNQAPTAQAHPIQSKAPAGNRKTSCASSKEAMRPGSLNSRLVRVVRSTTSGHMSTKHIDLGIALVLILSTSTGCVFSLGSNGRGSASADPTIGQELIDLKKARDGGAITGEEYEAQKKKVMAQ